ncbi:uncharacterized protein PV07_10636 [Cladophialophora immunda]|uniref:Heterokaryon incompatibility domain-containing protein n=1 Tax=Cladophialophora immunda TaxID=569365 RepID=A0A0D2C3E8_9EURO|nr:uncharacterized protein PV07_10636 [Cladophialophora immunda]KIW24960.1 hypothetical protein PV07_10636 [Cladophialophora immunda]
MPGDFLIRLTRQFKLLPAQNKNGAAKVRDTYEFLAYLETHKRLQDIDFHLLSPLTCSYLQSLLADSTRLTVDDRGTLFENLTRRTIFLLVMDRMEHTRLRVIHSYDQVSRPYNRGASWLVPPPPPYSTWPKCWTCQDLNFRRNREEYTKYPIQVAVDVRDLMGSAGAGCEACATLWNLIQWFRGGMHDVKSLVLSSVKPRSPLVVFVDLENGDSEYLEIYTRENEPVKWPIIGAAREISLNSSSYACMNLASQWIKECTDTHADCRRRSRHPLPTRVINVGSDVQDPFLYESRGEEAQYIALSHCWGDSVALTTTKENLADRKKGVRMDDLPRTFQDAITVARRLNIEYLWIDSLCIIQNDSEDWDKEAAKMADVYAGAHFTIAADGAADCNGGLFVGGDQRNTEVKYHSAPGVWASRSRIYIRKQMVRTSSESVSHSIGPSGRSKLNTRGWVLQERILSPRTLHFTASEMSWECVSSLKCECQVEATSSFAVQTFEQKYVKDHVKCIADDGTIDVWPHLDWSSVVESYTTRDLTKTSDLLPALSGLAAAMSRCTSYSYLAGIWKEELPWGLLWATEVWERQHDKIFTVKRHHEYYAPSWSWASVTGYVRYRASPTALGGQGRMHSAISILETHCEPAGPNPYGPLRSGFMKVSGPVVQVRIWPTTRSKVHGLNLSHWDVHPSVRPDEDNAFLIVSERDIKHGTDEKHSDSGFPEPEFHMVPDVLLDDSFNDQSRDINAKGPVAVIYNRRNHANSANLDEEAHCPYSVLEPDIKSHDYGVDASQPHLLLLTVYWEPSESRDDGKQDFWAMVLRMVPGDETKWQRVGIMRSFGGYGWKEWQQVSSQREVVIV